MSSIVHPDAFWPQHKVRNAGPFSLNGDIFAVLPIGPNGYVGIFRSSDDGGTWSQVAIGSHSGSGATDACVSNGMIVVACCDSASPSTVHVYSFDPSDNSFVSLHSTSSLAHPSPWGLPLFVADRPQQDGVYVAFQFETTRSMGSDIVEFGLHSWSPGGGWSLVETVTGSLRVMHRSGDDEVILGFTTDRTSTSGTGFSRIYSDGSRSGRMGIFGQADQDWFFGICENADLFIAYAQGPDTLTSRQDSGTSAGSVEQIAGPPPGGIEVASSNPVAVAESSDGIHVIYARGDDGIGYFHRDSPFSWTYQGLVASGSIQGLSAGDVPNGFGFLYDSAGTISYSAVIEDTATVEIAPEHGVTVGHKAEIKKRLPPPGAYEAEAVSDSQINIRWDLVEGAEGYEIERDGVVIATVYP